MLRATPSERPPRAGESATGYALRVFPRALDTAARRSTNKPNTYTYPQLTIKQSATSLGSKLDRQGGSNLNRRRQALDSGHVRAQPLLRAALLAVFGTVCFPMETTAAKVDALSKRLASSSVTLYAARDRPDPSKLEYSAFMVFT